MLSRQKRAVNRVSPVRAEQIGKIITRSIDELVVVRGRAGGNPPIATART
jgi:hypothetical protein